MLQTNTNPTAGGDGVRQEFPNHEPVSNSQFGNKTQASDVDFLTACLRGAALRAKLAAVDFDTVGIALRNNLVSHDGALAWLDDIGLINHVLYRSGAPYEARQ